MKPIIQTLSAPVTAGRVAPTLPLSPSIRTDAVYVVFTSVDETMVALRAAAAFARPLGTPVTLVHLRTVPFALPVDAPTGISPIETQGFVDRLAAEGVEVQVRVCLCRTERDAVRAAFKNHCLIVVGAHRSVWRRSSARLHRLLEQAGHYVVVKRVENVNA